MSWNGATEVSRWLLEGFENNNENNEEEEEEENETTRRRSRPSRLNRSNNPVEKISLVAKKGFETIYRISSSSKAISYKTRFVRVVALDRDDNVLGTSDVMDLRGMNRDDDDEGIINNSQQGEEKQKEEKGEKNFSFKLTNIDILLISFVGLLISLSFKFIFAFTAIGGRGKGKGRRGSKDKEMQEQQQQDKKKKKQKSKYQYSLLLQ